MFYPKKIANSGEIQGHFEWPTSKIVCIGRNYSEHAKELNNPIPEEPLLFIKSTNSIVNINYSEDSPCSIEIPTHLGACHHELEIAFLVGKKVTKGFCGKATECIAGVGLGLDLTLRDLQNQLKSKGQPWERAKSFDGSCPMTGFIPTAAFQTAALQTSDFQKNTESPFSNIAFDLSNHTTVLQAGNSGDMLFDLPALLKSISSCFTLYPGDVILSGTPAGVAALKLNDFLRLSLSGQVIGEIIVQSKK